MAPALGSSIDQCDEFSSPKMPELTTPVYSKPKLTAASQRMPESPSESAPLPFPSPIQDETSSRALSPKELGWRSSTTAQHHPHQSRPLPVTSYHSDRRSSSILSGSSHGGYNGYGSTKPDEFVTPTNSGCGGKRRSWRPKQGVTHNIPFSVHAPSTSTTTSKTTIDCSPSCGGVSPFYFTPVGSAGTNTSTTPRWKISAGGSSFPAPPHLEDGSNDEDHEGEGEDVSQAQRTSSQEQEEQSTPSPRVVTAATASHEPPRRRPRPPPAPRVRKVQSLSPIKMASSDGSRGKPGISKATKDAILLDSKSDHGTYSSVSSAASSKEGGDFVPTVPSISYHGGGRKRWSSERPATKASPLVSESEHKVTNMSISRRASMPLPLSPYSPSNNKKRWTMKQISNIKKLPPAFQAAYSAQQRAGNDVGKNEGDTTSPYSQSQLTPPTGGRRASRRPTFDPSKLELVKSPVKEKLTIGKLQRRWPPVETNSPLRTGLKKLPSFSLEETLGAARSREVRQALEKSCKTPPTSPRPRTPCSSPRPSPRGKLVLDTFLDSLVLQRLPLEEAIHQASSAAPSCSAALKTIIATERRQILQDLKESWNQHRPRLSGIWTSEVGNRSQDDEVEAWNIPPHLEPSQEEQVRQAMKACLQDDPKLQGIWTASSSSVTNGNHEDYEGSEEWSPRQWQEEHPQVLSSLKISWAGPTFYDPETIRPLYFQDNYVNENGQTLPFCPLLEDRCFGDSNTGNDVAPSCPSRSRDLRDLQVEEENEDNDNIPKPTVWLAQWCVSRMDTDQDADVWRVKRMWDDDESLNAKEQEHVVARYEIMTKIKELLGIPIAGRCSYSLGNQYQSSAEDWCITQVLDWDGEIQALSRTEKVDERKARQYFIGLGSNQKVNKTSRSPSVTSTGTASTCLSVTVAEDAETELFREKPACSEMEGMGDERKEEVTRNVQHEPLQVLPCKAAEVDKQASARVRNCEGDSVIAKETTIASLKEEKAQKLPDTPRRKSSTKKRKSKKSTPSSIWDLLSPPPVSYLVNSEEHYQKLLAE